MGKDGKYFERRKRNNVAAKKSRDARKQREDEIAIRASFLEKENSILKVSFIKSKDFFNP
jgi:leukemia factor-related protein